MAFLPGAVQDKSTYTEGSSPVTPVGGEYNDGSATLTTGQVAGIRITEKRAAHVNLRREDGTEIGTAATPIKTDGSGVTQPVSGSISVSNFPSTQATQDAADGTPGSAAPGKAQLVGGSDGANLRALLTDASGRPKVLLFDGSGNAITSTANALDVNIKSGAGSGFSAVDESAWTAGASPFAPNGGVFNDSAAALTTGQQGTLRATPNRARHVNMRRQDGTEVGTSSNPFIVSLSAAMIQPVRTVTANDTATINDFLILANAASGAITETLPTGLSSLQTMVLTIKKTDATANTVTISAPNIDGQTSIVLYTQNASLTVQWNGSNWSIEAYNPGLWATWTPTYSASGSMTVTLTTLFSARYILPAPNIVSIQFFASLTLGGTASNTLNVSLPITSRVGFIQILMGIVGPGAADSSCESRVSPNASTVSIFPPGGANYTLGVNNVACQGQYGLF